MNLPSGVTNLPRFDGIVAYPRGNYGPDKIFIAMEVLKMGLISSSPLRVEAERVVLEYLKPPENKPEPKPTTDKLYARVFRNDPEPVTIENWKAEQGMYSCDGKPVEKKLTGKITIENSHLVMTLSNGVRSVIKRQVWVDAGNPDNRNLQTDINKLLIQTEDVVGNMDENDLTFELTPAQAQGITDTTEYKLYALGAPDPLSPDYEEQSQIRYDAERGKPIKMGTRLYGIKVKVLE